MTPKSLGYPCPRCEPRRMFGVRPSAARTSYPDASDTDEERRRKKQKKVEEDRRKYVGRVQDHIVDVEVKDSGWSNNKSVLCPLRAPWGKRPVVIPGDSLKGLLRHELGALLGAPMERVAERSYSYRPNALFPNRPGARLVARLARVPNDGVETKSLDGAGGVQVRVPTRLELLPTNLRYDKRRRSNSDYYRFDDGNGAPYRGGQGAGERLNSKRNLHRTINANHTGPTESADVPQGAQDGYLATLRHLIDEATDISASAILTQSEHGDSAGTASWMPRSPRSSSPAISSGSSGTPRRSASSRSAGTTTTAGPTPTRFARGAASSNGTACSRSPRSESATPMAPPLASPQCAASSATRSTRERGQRWHRRGRPRAAHGAAVPQRSDRGRRERRQRRVRFLKPTFLKELGMPRPSAVEHYLKQPHHPQSRPSDRAKLVTYGDASGYDEGRRAGGA